MGLESRVRCEIMRCQSMQISLKHLTSSLVCSAPSDLYIATISGARSF